MGWIVALVTIPAVVMLCFMLRRLEGDKGMARPGGGLAGATGAKKLSWRLMRDHAPQATGFQPDTA